MSDPDEIEWRVSEGLTDFAAALAEMGARADAVREGKASELVWLLEHPALFTSGTSADPAELFNPLGLPVHVAGRGGRYTFHGPGQRVVYLVLDLERRGKDVRCFVHSLEDWIIGALALLGVSARRAPGRIGIWTGTGAEEAKIGAIGVRVRRWVTMHGFAINVAPDLSLFAGIVPCGISDFGVTSLERIGAGSSMKCVDDALKRGFSGFLDALGGGEQAA